MKRSLMLLAMLALLVGLSNVSVAQEKSGPAVAGPTPDTVEVTETGTGTSKEEALRDAMRKCVERGAGTTIFSRTEVKDFTLAKDTILAKAAGFISKWEALKPAREVDDGTWTITIKAVVSMKGVSDVWGTVTTMLGEMGRPKIMVFINEKVSGEAKEDSTVQTGIESLLLKSGFILVNKEQIKEIDRKDLAAAVAEDKPDKVQAIAKRFGAAIFISGSAEAKTGGASNIGGMTMTAYEAVANVKTYRADTGQLISSIPGRATRGAGRTGLAAAQQSLDFQSQQIAGQVVNDILEHWMEAMSGRGEIQLHVDNIKFADYVKLKKALAELKQIKAHNTPQFANNTAEASIQSDVKAEELAEKLVEAMPELEITDVTQNVIKATLKAK